MTQSVSCNQPGNQSTATSMQTWSPKRILVQTGKLHTSRTFLLCALGFVFFYKQTTATTSSTVNMHDWLVAGGWHFVRGYHTRTTSTCVPRSYPVIQNHLKNIFLCLISCNHALIVVDDVSNVMNARKSKARAALWSAIIIVLLSQHIDTSFNFQAPKCCCHLNQNQKLIRKKKKYHVRSPLD